MGRRRNFPFAASPLYPLLRFARRHPASLKREEIKNAPEEIKAHIFVLALLNVY